MYYAPDDEKSPTNLYKIHQLYLERRQPGAQDTFYLHPRKAPSEAGVCFDNVPIGHNTLAQGINFFCTSFRQFRDSFSCSRALESCVEKMLT